MDNAATVFLGLQTFGALFGACAVVWGEVVYLRAMRDKKIDKAERAHLDSIAVGLRFGMLIMLLSSLGLVINAYFSAAAAPPALLSSYWILMSLAFLIIWASWALSRERVSFAHGSAIIFTGWWFLAYLTLGWLPFISFGSAVMSFIVLTIVFYAFLQALRYFVLRH